MSYLLKKATRGPQWNAEEHSVLRAEFFLEEGFEARFQGPRLEFSAGNLVPPNSIRIQINQRQFDFRPPPQLVETAHWSSGRAREYWVELPLPRDTLRAGRNTVRVHAETLPGLARIHPLSFDALTLRLPARPDRGPSPGGTS